MITAQCATCALYLHDTDTPACVAFPDGIPEEILTGEFDHTTAYPGDNGWRFMPTPQGTAADVETVLKSLTPTNPRRPGATGGEST
jgi:hypothetical protein